MIPKSTSVSFTFVALLLIVHLTSFASTHPTLDSGHHSLRSLTGRSAPVLELNNISANLPPAGFSFQVDHDTKAADSRSTFWLSFMAMADLAALDFESSTDESLVIKKPRTGGMILTLSDPNHPRGGFKIKYMVWGLLSAIRYMDGRGEWRNYRFTFKWQGKIVGSLIFVGARNSAVVDEWFPPSLLTDSSNANAVLSFQIRWSPVPVRMPFNDVMMSLIGGLSDLATHDLDDRIDQSKWQTAFPPYDARIELEALARAHNWWTYSVVFDCLYQLFEWYMRHHPIESRGADILILIDGKEHGRGQVQLDRARQVVSTS